MLFPDTVNDAYKQIRPYVRKTPLEPAHTLYTNQREVYLKLECLQHTRSFKVRGALNKLLSLDDEEKEKGIVTASTGNHGMAVTFGLKQLDVSGTIYLPETVSERKLNVLKRYGANVQFFGDDSVYTEQYARKQADERGQVYISPYNDPKVVAGQGTIGVELLNQLPSLDAVFVPVGGGGMIGGISGYLKAKNPAIRIIGCLPANSPVMLESIEAGKIVAGTVLPTLSDGTVGGIEEGAITFDLCRQHVDDWVLVEEEEIQAGMKLLFDEYNLVVEGAAGVSVASFLKYTKANPSADLNRVVIVLCGGNVDVEQFKRLVF
ncbi:MAG: threonine/serine dehydratase [Rhodothermaceae bacterium]|nr:threonine/serine dehydratase [Rhodothermaceae bacterium]